MMNYVDREHYETVMEQKKEMKAQRDYFLEINGLDEETNQKYEAERMAIEEENK